jgi:hypothetical protein
MEPLLCVSLPGLSATSIILALCLKFGGRRDKLDGDTCV